MAVFVLRPGVRVEALGDEGWVAFSPASGETQFLNHEAAALLELLAEAPRSLQQASETLATDVGIAFGQILEALEASAPELETRGLIVGQPQ